MEGRIGAALGASEEGGEEPGGAFGAQLDLAAGRHEGLFGVVGRKFDGVGCDPAGPAEDGEAVPRLTDTGSVDRSGIEVADELAGGKLDDLDFALGGETDAVEPLEHEKVVGGYFVHDAEDKAFAPALLADVSSEFIFGADAGVPVLAGDSDAIAIAIEDAEADAGEGLMPDAGAGGKRHRPEGMGEVQFPEEQFFPDCRPPELTGHLDLEIELGKKAFGASDEDRGGIPELDKAETDRREVDGRKGHLRQSFSHRRANCGIAPAFPVGVSQLIDIRQLNNFVALAEERSFTRAAKRVFLSQSAVSHSLRNLEAEMSCKLIKRAGQTILLTEHGEVFYREAREIVAQVVGLRQRMAELSEWGRGRLRIGAGATACQYFLPAVLRELRETFPRCELSIQPSDTHQSLRALRVGEIDVALIVRGGDLERIAHRDLFKDELHAVFPLGHNWALKDSLRVKDFESETVLQHGVGTVTHQLLSDYFADHGIHLNRSIELSSMDALREMARIGQGIAFLPSWVLNRPESHGLVGRPLPGGPVKRDWALATLAGKSLSILEATFQGLCEEHALSFAGHNRTLFAASG